MDITTFSKRFAILVFAAGGIAACSEQSSDTDSSAAAPQKEMAGSDEMQQDNPVQAAVDNPSRPDEDRARDENRKPGEVLAYYGIGPGMKVLELAAGGGYYTRMISAAVGPEGKVYAQNSERFWPRLKDTVEPLYAELGNIESLVTDYSDAANDIEEGSLDAIMLILIYHHMHYTEEEGEALAAGGKSFFDAAMKALKPGGVLAIVEHQAAEGTSRADNNTWHRVAQSYAVADATGSGFVFEGEGGMLHNADDDMKNYWREALERGKSQRFVLKFRKP